MAHLGTARGPDVQTGPASDRVSLTGLGSRALIVTSENATFARTLMPEGRVTAPVRLSAPGDSDTFQVASAASRKGAQVAAWRNSKCGLSVARSSDPTAQAWSAPRTLTAITSPSGKGGIENPSVAINSAGSAIVGWQGAGQTWVVAVP